MINVRELIKIHFFVLGVAILTIACNRNHLQLVDQLNALPTDTTIKSIKYEFDSPFLRYLNLVKSSLRLDTISNEKIVLRLWTDDPSSKVFHRIFQLTIDNDSVRYYKITYRDQIESRNPFKETIISLSSIRIFPIHNGNDFVWSVFDKEFKELLDQRKVKFIGGLEGNSVTVEFKVKDNYYRTSFEQIEDFEVKSLPYKKIREVLELLEREFEWSKYLKENTVTD
jgi:hypothetical protein